jgi:predicted enzyme related to lactoylglutathione lyase
MTRTSRNRRPRRIRLVASVAIVGSLALSAGWVAAAKVDLSAMTFTSEPLVGKVIWNDLVTDDIAAARSFYGSLFGWTFEQGSARGGRAYSLARSGGVYVAGLVEMRSEAQGTEFSRWLPYISVPDVDAAIAKATPAGAKVVAGPLNVRFGRVAALTDPEGAVFGLIRSNIGDPDDKTTAPAPGRVVWTEMLSNDPDLAAGFYKTVVGYTPNKVHRRGGEYTVLMRGKENRAGILKNPSEQADPVWLTYFGVDDPAATAARAEELGGSILLPVSPELREGTMAVVTDPTGALLVLRKVGA